jgi:hypothetical protein
MGPIMYIPKVEVKMVGIINPEVVGSKEALKIKGLKNCTDSTGTNRKAGEEWLHRK